MLVASALDQDVEHDAGLVHGSPKPMLYSGNFEHNLIQMQSRGAQTIGSGNLGGAEVFCANADEPMRVNSGLATRN